MMSLEYLISMLIADGKTIEIRPSKEEKNLVDVFLYSKEPELGYRAKEQDPLDIFNVLYNLQLLLQQAEKDNA